MSALTVIRALAATTGRHEKENIIADAFVDGERDFFTGARLAYDRLISFGVARVAEIAPDDLNPEDTGTFTFAEFLALAERLRTRQLTGHAARDAINEAASRCHGPTWNEFYRRVILKDMKIGCDETTINKVLKRLAKSRPEATSWLIPVFACQLAQDGEDPVHARKITGRRLLDTKLDGVRLLSVLDKAAGKVSLLTRNGQTISTFPAIRACLERLLAVIPGSIVLDGEIIHPEGFQHLMTMVKNPEQDSSQARLALFDIIPLDEFRAGLCAIPQWRRHENLALLATTGMLQRCGGAVEVIPKKEVDLDTEEGRRAFAEFNREAIDSGIEGIMIKDPEAPYEAKRTSAWLKKKPVIDVSLQVLGVEPGQADGKYAGVLGALVCAGVEDGRTITCHVGSGFTDQQRVEFWAARDRLIGLIAEVRADRMSLEAGSAVWSLRFPRFKGFRGTVPDEKL